VGAVSGGAACDRAKFVAVDEKEIVAISLLQLIASTNVFYSILSLLVDSVMVRMGKDEEMSYCLYFSNICL
jgi:hypothetical protein